MASEHPRREHRRRRDGQALGGTTPAHGEFWRQKARRNVEEWGEQSVETLLLAAQEELGELTRAVLEGREGEPTGQEVQAELDDLAALMFQLQWRLEDGEFP